MRLSILAAGAALLLCGTAAIAQTNPPTIPATPPPANAATDSTATSANHASAGALRGHIHDMLQQSGFSDIRMMPSSFMIRAKDQDGNPVVMSVSPDSVTEVSEVGTSGGNGTAGPSDAMPSSAATSGSTAMSSTSNGPPTTSEFVSVGQNDDLSSNLVGLDVYNGSNQDVGQIKDIAMGQQGRAQAYILSVGGFLGLGEHYVAVNPANIKVSYNTSDQKWHATTSATKAELKSATEFKYNGRWNASKS
jgi:hypothetical protein